MPTPTLSQARSHSARQRRITAGVLVAVRRLFKRNAPLTEVVSTVATYQLASAMASAQSVALFAEAPTPITTPAAFAGVSSYGFPIAEPIIATIDRFAPAPAEPIPANWWETTADFMAALEQLIAAEVQDAGRTASQVEIVGRPDWTNYVRLLNPPSCSRCAVLAGRIYRDLEAFQRHPLCDCVMVPVTSWEDAHDKGLVSSPQDLFDRGQMTGLSEADNQAIRDGADITTIVNATRGTSAPGITNALTTEVFGRKVKATTYGTTKRAAWRKANPTRLVRLRPESIYRFAESHEDAVRLLRLYGYLSD